MTVSLSKGGNVSLTKEAPGISKMTVGLGWDARTTDGTAFDLDASAIVVNTSGKVLSDSDFVFFNNKTNSTGSVTHSGDNLTGEGGGDDEQISIDLSKLPPEADKVVVVVSIYQAEQNGQNFGMVRNAYVRVVNDDGGTEVARFDLSEDMSTETAMVFGEIYKNGSDWKFKAIGQGYSAGLGGIAKDYGVSI